MIRRWYSLFYACCILLLAACTPQEAREAEEAAWADDEPTAAANDAQTDRLPQAHAAAEDYAPLIRRLEEMVDAERTIGETMITGESLILDYERRFVRLDQQVKVVDDHGVLETETLIGRFSEENEVEMVEARRGVRITSGERLATAGSATYELGSGAVVMEDEARLSEGGHRLSGDRIQFWLKGSRRMVCEPNALFEMTSDQWTVQGLGESGETTEIRAERVIFDEEQAQVEFAGNVRLHNPQATLNCGRIRLYLKENSEIDWLEALSDVIIRTDARKAVADRAYYYADEGKFVLTGDPVVTQGRNTMTGDQITFWHASQRMVCEPNARVLLYPDAAVRARFIDDLKE